MLGANTKCYYFKSIIYFSNEIDKFIANQTIKIHIYGEYEGELGLVLFLKGVKDVLGKNLKDAQLLGKLTQEIEGLKLEISGNKILVRNLKQEKGTIRKEIEVLKNDLAPLRNEIKQYDELIRSHQSILNDLHISITQQREIHCSLVRENLSLEQQQKNLISSIEILNQQTNLKATTIIELINQINKINEIKQNEQKNLQAMHKENIKRNTTIIQNNKGEYNSFYKFMDGYLEEKNIEFINLIKGFTNTHDCMIISVPEAADWLVNYRQTKNSYYPASNYKDSIIQACYLYDDKILILSKLLDKKGYSIQKNDRIFIEYLKYGALENNYEQYKVHFKRMRYFTPSITPLKEVFFSFFKTVNEEDLDKNEYLGFVSFYLLKKGYPLEYENLSILSGIVHHVYEEYKMSLMDQKISNFHNRNNKFKKITTEEINNMTGIEFEEFLMNLFKRLEFKVETTKKSGDQGVDLIAEKDGERLAIQAKRYSAAVGNKAVQEVIAGKKYYDADVAMVITNNTFTPAAIELASKTNTILWNENKLFEMIEQSYAHL